MRYTLYNNGRFVINCVANHSVGGYWRCACLHLFSILILKTLPTRECSADYSLLDIPGFCMRRVERKLIHLLPAEAYKSYDSFRKFVISVKEEKYSAFFNVDPNRLRRIKSAVEIKKPESRSYYFKAPITLRGLVESIFDIGYPKVLWDQIVADLGVRMIDYRDYPVLAYQFTDGTHFDKTQKSEFTQRFDRILLEKDTSY